MSNCCNGNCARSKPIRVLEGRLTRSIYAITNYTERGDSIIATTKHDVTEDVRHLMQVAWDAGHAASLGAGKGDIVPNPYAPPTTEGASA